MKAIKKFDEFIKQGIVKQQSPDKPRAEFLVKEAKQNYSFVLELINKFEIKNSNANIFIKSCYDVLMELIRAKMLLKGYNASGFGAHEAEVSYLRELGFSERDVQFADQIRFFRNGMLYYGNILDREYAEKVFEFLTKIYPVLLKLID
ncbi:MAG: hypothetical protein ABIH28_02195 [archaeon]